MSDTPSPPDPDGRDPAASGAIAYSVLRATAGSISEARRATASAFALKVFAQRAIWFRFAPIRASSRVRSRSTSACATVQRRTRPTDRRTRSDSVNPAELALACHSARSASLARIFTHTSRPAPMMCRWGVRGGTAPRQPLPGTREAWPQRVGWLPCAKQTRPPTLGNLCRENPHTRTVRSLLHAVSTRGKHRISEAVPFVVEGT